PSPPTLFPYTTSFRSVGILDVMGCGVELVAGAHLLKRLEQTVRLGFRLAFQDLGHHRCRGRRYGTSPSFEGHIVDRPIRAHLQVDGQPIAAERVVALGLTVRVFGMTQVARTLPVIEDDFLIKLAQIVRHQPKISRTWSSASVS